MCVCVYRLYIDIGYIRVPQILPWRANALQSLAPTLIKLAYLWFSNDPEDIDWHAQVCLIRVRAKLCRKVDLVGQI